MAAITLNSHLPNTAVDVYLRTDVVRNVREPSGAVPAGATPVANGTVAPSGFLTITGLLAKTGYYAYATVDNRWIRFTTDDGLGDPLTPGTVAPVTATSGQIAASNTARNLLVICNDDDYKIVYLELGTAAAVLGRGIRLNAAGGSLALRGDEAKSAVQAIAIGSASVTVTEV